MKVFGNMGAFLQNVDFSTLPREIRTSRLHLRRWKSEDRPLFAQMNGDPVVMEHFPGCLSPAESDEMADRIQRQFEEFGFGLWAVEVIGGSPFCGFVGLIIPRFEAHFTPCIEIGWRLSTDVWGRGYATEAARVALDFAFQYLNVDEVVAVTTVANTKSRRVMEKLEMTRNPTDDFDHPLVPAEDPVCRHVLYRRLRDHQL